MGAGSGVDVFPLKQARWRKAERIDTILDEDMSHLFAEVRTPLSSLLLLYSRYRSEKVLEP